MGPSESHEKKVFRKNPNMGLQAILKFMFSKKATKIDEIFTVDLTVTTYSQIGGEDFVIFCGLLRKREFYQCSLIDF